MPTSALIPANQQRSLMKSASNNSITDNTSNLNSEELTIEDMLRGIKYHNGQVFFNLFITENHIGLINISAKDFTNLILM